MFFETSDFKILGFYREASSGPAREFPKKTAGSSVEIEYHGDLMQLSGPRIEDARRNVAEVHNIAGSQTCMA